MIHTKLLPITALLLALSTVLIASPQSSPDVDRFKAAALKGSLPDAESLARHRDKRAIEAMREVLTKCDNVQVKIAMLQGLGHNNKDLDSVPMFLDIMDKDDQLLDLHAKANEAAINCGISSLFFDPKGNIDERRDIVREMRDEIKKLKEMNPKLALAGKQLPEVKLLFRETRLKETYQMAVPLSGNNIRVRLGEKYPQSATSFHLEIEFAPAAFHWDFNDLVIRVDLLRDGSVQLTTVSAIASPYSFDLVDNDGKMLVYDFGPAKNPTHKFPAK